jgi:hypothetical protein
MKNRRFGCSAREIEFKYYLKSILSLLTIYFIYQRNTQTAEIFRLLEEVELQRSRQKDAVASWQFLIRKWDAAFASYRAATEAHAMIGTLHGPTQEQEAAQAKALAELTQIKQQIDNLIAEGARRRGPIVDSIVVGIIEKEGDRPHRALEEVRAPSLGPPVSARKKKR